MKKLLLLITLSGCAAGMFSVERTAPVVMYIESLDESGLHKAATWGNYIKHFRNGDSVTVIGHQGDYFYAASGNDTGFVEKTDVIDRWDFALKQTPLEFKLLKAESDDAWGRANLFLSQNGDMKLQNATDYLLETYNPTRSGLTGYRITRSPVKDSVMFTVKAIPFGNTEHDLREADKMARRLAKTIMQ